MILSSKISTKYANTGKNEKLNLFISEYREAVDFYVDYLWNVRLEIGSRVFDIKNQKYNTPKFISSDIKPHSDLSARALKCAATQACGLIGAKVRKLQKTQYIIKKKQRAGINVGYLQSKYDKLVGKLKRPYTANVRPELNSICCNYIETISPEFDGVIKLSSLGKKYGTIYLPVKLTRHYNALMSKGKRLNSFLLSRKSIDFRVDINTPAKKTTGTTEGCDQGINTVLTLSDGQITPNCKHGHDLKSILITLTNKKKGSKAFEKCQQHRTNYINWSVKQLNLSGIQQINVEKLRHMRRGKSSSRYLSGFVYPEILSALEKHCELNGVHLTEQSNAYRSQRCSQCGYVHKSNRKGKLFTCRNCAHAIDADLNAALNHKVQLYDLPFRTSHLPNRSDGFFWNSFGIYSVNGEEFTVPLDIKTI